MCGALAKNRNFLEPDKMEASKLKGLPLRFCMLKTPLNLKEFHPGHLREAKLPDKFTKVCRC